MKKILSNLLLIALLGLGSKSYANYASSLLTDPFTCYSTGGRYTFINHGSTLSVLRPGGQRETFPIRVIEDNGKSKKVLQGGRYWIVFSEEGDYEHSGDSQEGSYFHLTCPEAVMDGAGKAVWTAEPGSNWTQADADELKELTRLGFLKDPHAPQAKELQVLQNLFILSADLSKIQISDLEKLMKAGAQGFELPGTVSTMADCKRLGGFIKEHHLPAGLNVAVDTSRDPSSLDPFIRQAGIDYLKSRIDCAAEIGATIMAGPIVLPWGGFYDTDSTVELHEHFLKPKLEVARESMRQVADYARQRGIKLALEPLHRHEMHGLNTMVEAAAFIKEVNHPNFGVCLDSSHEVIDGAGPDVYAALVQDLYEKGFFIYAQVSAPSRGDIKNSWIPWDHYLGLLKRIGVASVTIEIMQAAPPFTARNGGSIRLSRLPFADPFQVAQDAIHKTCAEWLKAGK